MRNLGTELDGDSLHESVELLSQLLMELEVEQLTGAKKYERTPQRRERRNEYRDRTCETRVGEIPLRIAKLRSGSYFPSLLQPRRRAERALLAVVQSAHV